MRKGFDRSSNAASALFGILLGAAVFSTSLVVLMNVSVEMGTRPATQSHDDALKADASILAELLLNPGAGWYLLDPCPLGTRNPAIPLTPLLVERYGLGVEPSCREGFGDSLPSVLDLEKVEASRGTPGVQTTVGGRTVVGDPAMYDRALATLRLHEAPIEFHLSGEAVGASGGGSAARYARTLYIGDYSPPGANPAPDHVAGVIDGADRATVYVNVMNDGATPTAFSAAFAMELKNGDITFTLHTPVLAAGQSGNMTFTLLKTSDWDWKSANNKVVEYQVHDSDLQLIDGEISLAAVAMTHASTRLNAFAYAEKLAAVYTGGPAKHLYKSYNGKGQLADFSDWTYRLTNSLGATVRTDVLPTGKQGEVSHTYLLPGTHTATLWNDALTTAWNRDTVNVVAVEPGPYAGNTLWTPGPSVYPEARYLDLLSQSFQANAYSPTYASLALPFAVGGDVVPDDKAALDTLLPAVLTPPSPLTTEYDVVVVGSMVDHEEFTSGPAKQAVEAWVRAGGILIVVGSASNSYQWLQPLFHVSQQAASGSTSLVQPDHEAIASPNALDVATYADHSKAWRVGAQSTALFDVVSTRGDATLAVSPVGAIGAGRVLITSFRPYDMLGVGATGPCDPAAVQPDCAGSMLLENSLTLAAAAGPFEFGLVYSGDEPAGTSTRVVSLEDPVHGVVEYHLRLVVWRFESS